MPAAKTCFFPQGKKEFLILKVGHGDGCAIHWTIQGVGFLQGSLAQRQEQGKGHGYKWLIPLLVDLETLPGLDSFTEPMIITRVWDIAREGHSHCFQGLWPEGRKLGLWQGLCSASLDDALGLR